MESWQKKITHIPDLPGVYIYKDIKGIVIYVGKAKRLIRRVKQYVQKPKDISPKTVQLATEIFDLEIIVTASEFDAILLEAKLIRQWMPKYNVIAKDDKSLLYVALTLNERLPRLLLLRKGEIASYQTSKRNKIFGPFQSARALRELLSQLRRAIPYCTQKRRNGTPCFYTHVGLCDPCPSQLVNAPESDQTQQNILLYRKNINAIKDVFEGKTTTLIDAYTRLMKSYAKKELFEDAAIIKRRIDMLYALSSYSYDPLVFIEQGVESVFEGELEDLLNRLHAVFPQLQTLDRIECFDMSQLFGISPVGSMVVLTNGFPDTKEYRKFRIQNTGVVSDVSMIREVLLRRFLHKEWKKPSFILIDGGKPQLTAAKTVFQELHITVPYAGLAKRYEELIIPSKHAFLTLRLPLSSKALRVLQRIRDEAHRFAIAYHRLLRKKSYGLT